MKNEGDPFLLVSGRCENKKLLTDKKFFTSVLNSIPNTIGMRTIRDPIISEARNNPGLEGYVQIDESNITISTYIKDPRFVACIHSCKDFDYKRVLEYLREEFRAKDMKYLYCHESDFMREK